MIFLTTTSDILHIITSAAVSTDVHASWMENLNGTITPGRTNTNISTATTTTVVSAPASSAQKNIRHMTIRAVGGGQTVTISHYDGSLAVVLFKATLLVNEEIGFTDSEGFRVFDSSGNIKTTGFPIGSSWGAALATALGANWPTALAASATSGAANGIDAATLSGSGIGVNNPIAYADDLDTQRKGGFYLCAYAGGRHFPGTANGSMTVMPGDASNCMQFFLDYATYILWRRIIASGSPVTGTGTTADGWLKIWDLISDGNGGRPPSPKAVNDAGITNIIGRLMQIVSSTPNSDLTLPAGGTWAVTFSFYAVDGNYGTAIGHPGGGGSNVPRTYSGGVVILPALSGNYGFAMVWRQS